MENAKDMRRLPAPPPRPKLPPDLILHIASVGGLLLTGILLAIGWQAGVFESQDTFARFIIGLGLFAVPLFILIQGVQVVIPILPAAIGCSVGVVVYGPVLGFVYNYIGICLGSIVAFLLARRYGMPLVRRVASNKLLDKYTGWLTRESRAFNRMFAIAIFSPVAPDDFLCYLAGLTQMPFRKFLLILLLGKPSAILLYSAGLTALLTLFWK